MGLASASSIRTRSVPAVAVRPSHQRIERSLIAVPVPELRHVVFDLDGTLVDSRADLAAAVNAGLAAVGCGHLSRAKIVSFIGHGTARLVACALEAAAAPPSAGADALGVFHEYYAAHLLDRTRLYEGIADLLAALDGSGIRVSVLSNKNEGYSRAILHGLGVGGLVAEVLGGDTLGRLKPEPEGLQALVSVGAVPARATAMVGDSVVDIEVARRADVAAFGVAWGFGEAAALSAAGAQRILRRPADLQPGGITHPSS